MGSKVRTPDAKKVKQSRRLEICCSLLGSEEEKTMTMVKNITSMTSRMVVSARAIKLVEYIRDSSADYPDKKARLWNKMRSLYRKKNP